ncbi:fanconi-associated nuclease 1, partial [Patella vulgata]|uniref:fanconi-associated nuclease 1 n=1 Tax=Patella vulgata TaxID=6465 RepID=UPI00217FEFE5
YTDRDSVLLYEKALQLEADFISCIERSKWEEAYQLYLVVKREYHDLPVENIRYDAKLPDFLRRYTTGHLYVRMLSQGIEIFQRRKDYHRANDLIRLLLKQDVYCFDYHGYWWERLALNLDAHLKNPFVALETVKEGLDDENVRVGHRLALYQRAEKICQIACLELKYKLTDFYHDEVIEAPKTTIEGRTIPYAVPGIKYKFMTQDSYSTDKPEDVTMCNVEQVVLDYYKDHDYPEGIHAEGSIISTLFTLFFWDILFMDVPDAFHSLYQTNPLDKMSEEFYRRRKDEIDERLQWLDNSSIEDLEERSSDTWNKYNETTCAGINWERLQSLEYIQGLIQCIGGKLLCGLLSRYAKDPRHTRSGFPDLTLWNTENKTFKIVEVKGPGDRLSHKQILWLSYLCKLGIDAEVCHVKAVGVKKLKARPLTAT